MKKNDILEVTAIDYSMEGWAIVKPQNFPLFVRGLIVGEKAEVVITRIEKRYGYARVLRLLDKSPVRIEALCPIAAQCGGCQFQHIEYSGQLVIKNQLVKQALERKGQGNYNYQGTSGMVPALPYRNKVQIPFFQNAKGQLLSGFYRLNSHEIVAMEYCYLQSRLTNDIYLKVKELVLIYDFATALRHLILKESSSEKEIMVILVVKEWQIKDIETFVAELAKAFPEIVSIFLNYNDSSGNTVLGEKSRLLYGRAYIVDRLLGCTFQITAKAFYQVNSQQCEKLYTKALELAEVTADDCVMDLFCGIGTIGIIAAEKAKKVIGIEIVEEAIETAKINAIINKRKNTEFYCGDAGSVLSQLSERIDVVFIDPPRKGLSAQTIMQLKKLEAQRLIYISCNPLTFTRDVEELKEKYEVGDIFGFDMFPYTNHIEIVCCLRLKSAL